MSYIHVVYERYLGLKDALQKYPDLTTFVLSSEDFVIPRDTHDFVWLYIEDQYNLQIYSKILNSLGYQFPAKRLTNPIVPKRLSVKKGFRKKATAELGRMVARFIPVIVRQSFIPQHKDKIRFLLASQGRLWFDFEPEETLPVAAIDSNQRSKFRNINLGNTEFEKVLSSLLENDVPQMFIENYALGKTQALQRYPFKPKAILSGTSWCYEECFKFWAASQLERGATLAGMQHGGDYGLTAIHPLEEYEIKVTDRYYSWGWESQNHKSVHPMPVTKYLAAKPAQADNTKEGILLTTVCFSRYFYRYQIPRVYDLENYFDGERQFIVSLSSENRYKTRVRLFVVDYGWDCQKRWEDFDSRLTIEDWRTPFSQSMKECRLHVSDHLSSTFVDSLAINKPTILFWDPEAYKVRPEAESFMNDLRQVGILYDTPQAAARAVDQVYPDVESWWNEAQRQAVIKKFCHRFARTSPTALQEWVQEIKNLAQSK